MKTHNLTVRKVEAFRKHLVEEEKSEATVEKYMRDVNAFFAFSDSEISKDNTQRRPFGIHKLLCLWITIIRQPVLIIQNGLYSWYDGHINALW